MPIIDRARFIQNAYVVNNLEDACQQLHDIYGIGPFLINNESKLVRVTHRGLQVPPITMRLAFVQSGDMNIELIEQTTVGPSAFRDLFPMGTKGLHHVAMFTNDYEAERDAFAAAGHPIAMEFTLDRARDCTVCFIDTSTTLGHMIELYPNHPLFHDLYTRVRAAGETWDPATDELLQVR